MSQEEGQKAPQVAQAAEVGQLPPWEEMGEQDKEALIEQILMAIVQQRPIPKPMLRTLPTNILNALLAAITRLKSEGMLGYQHKIPERLQRLRELLQERLARYGGGDRQPTEHQVVDSLPNSLRNQIRGNEAINLRQAQARGAMELQSQLAATSPTL